MKNNRTLIPTYGEPAVTKSVCDHPYAFIRGEEHGNVECLKCGKNLNRKLFYNG